MNAQRLGWLLPMMALTLPVGATVYRCDVAGKPVYTDKPCTAGAAPHAMPSIGTMPAVDADASLGKAYDQREEESRQSREQADAAWLKLHEARKAEDARLNAAIAEGRVVKDMSPDQVRRVLGSPDELERRPGGIEEWSYGSGKARQVVVIEGGRVVRISGKKK
ncbi:MAG: hypothetical protein ACT4QA_02755 [Panacagrimonas sp.]